MPGYYNYSNQSRSEAPLTSLDGTARATDTYGADNAGFPNGRRSGDDVVDTVLDADVFVFQTTGGTSSSAAQGGTASGPLSGAGPASSSASSAYADASSVVDTGAEPSGSSDLNMFDLWYF